MVYLILASRNAFFEKMGKIWFGRNCERTFPPGTFNLQFAGKEWVGCGPNNSVSRLVRSFATTCHHRPLAGSVSKRVNPDDKTGPHAANHFWADNSWPRKSHWDSHGAVSIYGSTTFMRWTTIHARTDSCFHRDAASTAGICPRVVYGACAVVDLAGPWLDYCGIVLAAITALLIG